MAEAQERFRPALQSARRPGQQLAQPGEGIETPDQLPPGAGRKIAIGRPLRRPRLGRLFETPLDGRQEMPPGGAADDLAGRPLAIGQVAEELLAIRLQRRLDVVETLRAKLIGEVGRRQADRRHPGQQRIHRSARRVGDAGPCIADVGGEAVLDRRDRQVGDLAAFGDGPHTITPAHARMEAHDDRPAGPLAHLPRRFAEPSGDIQPTQRGVAANLPQDQHVSAPATIGCNLDAEFAALGVPAVRRAAGRTEIGVVTERPVERHPEIGVNLARSQWPATQRRHPVRHCRPEATPQQAALDDDDRSLVFAVNRVAQLPLQRPALRIGEPVHNRHVTGLVKPAAGGGHPHSFNAEA